MTERRYDMEKNYMIKIDPVGIAVLFPYTDWTSIQKCVDGPAQICGRLPADDDSDGFPYSIYCNEEFLFNDECAFNPVASIISERPIYGNAAVLCDGYDAEGEYDSLPMTEDHASRIMRFINLMTEQDSTQDIIAELRRRYEHEKPAPQYEVRALNSIDDLKELFGVEG